MQVSPHAFPVRQTLQQVGPVDSEQAIELAPEEIASSPAHQASRRAARTVAQVPVGKFQYSEQLGLPSGRPLAITCQTFASVAVLT